VRNVFLLLLLANLLLLGWVFWADPEPPVPGLQRAADELAIFGQAEPAVVDPAAGTSSQCLYIGPMPDLGAAQQLSSTLAERGIRAEPVAREGRVWLGHWVQIQGFADRAMADAARQRLLDAGLPDAYVMPDGPANIISLGVFRERGRAERVVEAARQAGFRAVMRDRVRTATEYWLAAGQSGGDQRAALGDLAANFDRILRTELGPCPAPAGSAFGAVAPE
jgi:SPOR domain